MGSLRMWVWISSGLLAVLGVFFVLDGRLATAAGENRVQTGGEAREQGALMLAKLASSQKIVNGLVTKDFGQIGRGASELVRICNATEWAARGDQIYAHHRAELRRQSQKLVKMAQEQNLDGAAFSYMHSLTTCISCHEYCRDVLRIADQSRTKSKIVPIPVEDDEESNAPSRPMRR
jgi:hypothetical protein